MRLTRLPQYLDKWLTPRGFTYQLVANWDTRSRSSGDVAQLMALGVHHAADSLSTTVEGTINWCCNSGDAPIGNGCVTRTKYGPRVVLWSVRATNTQGRGGPVLTSSGVVPLDAGNTRFFSWEAMNNGIGEPWDDAMCDCYVLACCAVIDCARSYGVNMNVGDIFAHFEWTNPTNPYGPSRKPDPAGPCRWNGQQNRKWDMDQFRGEVFKTFMAGATPAPAPTPTPTPTPPPTGTYTVVSGDSWWSISQKLGVSMNALIDANTGTYTVKSGDSLWGISRAHSITVDELAALNGISTSAVIYPGQVLKVPATSSTVIYPGQVLVVPGGTAPTPAPAPTPPPEPKAPNGLTAAQNQAAGAIAATPPPDPVIKNTLVHSNSPWLQQVLCAIPKLAADGGGPIYPPLWVGEGRLGDGPAVYRLFGDGGKAALAYWQSKNGLTPDGEFGPQSYERMRAVRGR